MKKLFILICFIFINAHAMESDLTESSKSVKTLLKKLSVDKNQQPTIDNELTTQINEKIDAFVKNPIARLNIKNRAEVNDNIKQFKANIKKITTSLPLNTDEIALLEDLLFDFLISRQLNLIGSTKQEIPQIIQQYPSYERANVIKMLLRCCICPKVITTDRIKLVLAALAEIGQNKLPKKNNNNDAISVMSFGAGGCLQEFITAEWINKTNNYANMHLIEDFGFAKQMDLGLTIDCLKLTDDELKNILPNINFSHFSNSQKYIKYINKSNIKPDIAMAVDLDGREDNGTDQCTLIEFCHELSPHNKQYMYVSFSPKGRYRAYCSNQLDNQRIDIFKKIAVTTLSHLENQPLTDQLATLPTIVNKELQTLNQQPITVAFDTDPNYLFQELVEKTAKPNTAAFALQNRLMVYWKPSNYEAQDFISPYDLTFHPSFSKSTVLIDKKLSKPHVIIRDLIPYGHISGKQ